MSQKETENAECCTPLLQPLLALRLRKCVPLARVSIARRSCPPRKLFAPPHGLASNQRHVFRKSLWNGRSGPRSAASDCLGLSSHNPQPASSPQNCAIQVGHLWGSGPLRRRLPPSFQATRPSTQCRRQYRSHPREAHALQLQRGPRRSAHLQSMQTVSLTGTTVGTGAMRDAMRTAGRRHPMRRACGEA